MRLAHAQLPAADVVQFGLVVDELDKLAVLGAQLAHVLERPVEHAHAHLGYADATLHVEPRGEHPHALLGQVDHLVQAVSDLRLARLDTLDQARFVKEQRVAHLAHAEGVEPVSDEALVDECHANRAHLASVLGA